MSWNSVSAGLLEVPAAGLQLRLDVLEDEVGRVDLTVRVRVADADDLSLVLEDQDEGHLGMRRQLAHLLLPGLEQRIDAVDVELGQREVVPRAVADDARDAGGRTVPIDADRRRAVRAARRRRRTGDRCRTRTCPCSAGWSRRRLSRFRAQVARRIERRRSRRLTGDLGARPRPRLPVRRDDDPFLAQRMPPLFPHGPGVSGSASSTRRCHASGPCR